jgi:hypothetical protein
LERLALCLQLVQRRVFIPAVDEVLIKATPLFNLHQFGITRGTKGTSFRTARSGSVICYRAAAFHLLQELHLESSRGFNGTPLKKHITGVTSLNLHKLTVKGKHGIS